MFCLFKKTLQFKVGEGEDEKVLDFSANKHGKKGTHVVPSSLLKDEYFAANLKDGHIQVLEVDEDELDSAELDQKHLEKLGKVVLDSILKAVVKAEDKFVEPSKEKLLKKKAGELEAAQKAKELEEAQKSFEKKVDEEELLNQPDEDLEEPSKEEKPKKGQGRK